MNLDEYFGIDEAGRGSIVGPVSAAVCQLWEDHSLIDDSKKLSEQNRDTLYQWIISHSYWGSGYASEEEIDKFNILQATFIAMERAWNDMMLRMNPQVSKYQIIVDGNQLPLIQSNKILLIRAEPKADANYRNVSAASIIAKVQHDYFLRMLPDCNIYKWDINKGYGTKDHIELIKKHGFPKCYRKSFKVKGLYRFGF